MAGAAARGLTAVSSTARTMPLLSPLAKGMAGGEYCLIWLSTGSPTDQRADDADLLCFDTAVLDVPVEILGAPVVELTLSSDRLTALIAIRLCNAAPNGESSRVTFGVLNLTHRQDHADSAPLVPGKTVRVTIKLDDIGYCFPAGHRIRFAIFSSYWPLLWPSSERATLNMLTGESLLTLPERPRQAEGFAPKFATSETAIPLHQEILRPSDNKWTITTDVETGWVEIRIEDDFGKAKNLEQGLITGGMGRELDIINPDDPLSARSRTQ